MRNLKQILVGIAGASLMTVFVVLMVCAIGQGIILSFGYFGVFPTGLSMLSFFDVIPKSDWIRAGDIGVGSLFVMLFSTFILMTGLSIFSAVGRWILNSLYSKR